MHWTSGTRCITRNANLIYSESVWRAGWHTCSIVAESWSTHVTPVWYSACLTWCWTRETLISGNVVSIGTGCWTSSVENHTWAFIVALAFKKYFSIRTGCAGSSSTLTSLTLSITSQTSSIVMIGAINTFSDTFACKQYKSKPTFCADILRGAALALQRTQSAGTIFVVESGGTFLSALSQMESIALLTLSAQKREQTCCTTSGTLLAAGATQVCSLRAVPDALLSDLL